VPNETRGLLRVESEGGWSVGDVVEFLKAFQSAYDGLLIFETVLEGYAAESRAWRRYGPFPLDLPFYVNLQRSAAFLDVPDEALARFIRPQDHLVLRRVTLASPGFWEFLGSLNPLEVLRRYLEDRHRRRQDREYREAHEHRTLELQNLVLENQVLRERIGIVRDLGMADNDLAPLLNRLVYETLERVAIVDARGMILPTMPSVEEETSG